MNEDARVTWKAARINSDLTQKEVCNTLHISPATLIKYENYEASPSCELAVRMCELYRRKIEYIFLQKPVNSINVKEVC